VVNELKESFFLAFACLKQIFLLSLFNTCSGDMRHDEAILNFQN
jgi:hypothetical protein